LIRRRSRSTTAGGSARVRHPAVDLSPDPPTYLVA
jgi:hypothetical protein